MSQIKHQLIIFGLFAAYIITRLIGISNISFTFWQSIWTFALKDSLFLIIVFIFTYHILNFIRYQPATGPRIIPGRTLKKILYPALLFSWLAIVIHTAFEVLKMLFPFKILPLYQFSNFMDETISHIFMFIPAIVLFFIITVLEIERPLKHKLHNPELILLTSLSLPLGILWGLNLTEGRLSAVTSLPLMLIVSTALLTLTIKHRLSLRARPWNLLSLITFFTGSASFIVWGLVYPSLPEFFISLK